MTALGSSSGLYQRSTWAVLLGVGTAPYRDRQDALHHGEDLICTFQRTKR